MPLYVNLLYPPHVARREAAAFTVRSQTGSLYVNNTTDYFAYHFAVAGYSTWRNWAIALAVVRPGETIIEIGANVGTETIGFSDIVGPRGVVFAFEPFPPLVENLRRSLEQRTFANVQIVECALADRAMTCKFIPPSPGNSGIGYLITDPAGDIPDDALDVASSTLNALADTLGPASLICMDTEGAEPAIVEGAREYIARHKPVIVIEATESSVRRFGYSLTSVQQLFTALEYDVFDIGRFGLNPVDDHAADVRNWAAFPHERSDLARRVDRAIKRCGLLPCIRHMNPMTSVTRRVAAPAE